MYAVFKAYNIMDEGDQFSVDLYEDGCQVGGCLFPVGPAGEDAAFALAKFIGDAFCRNDKAPIAGGSEGAYDNVLSDAAARQGHRIAASSDSRSDGPGAQS